MFRKFRNGWWRCPELVASGYREIGDTGSGEAIEC